MVEVIAAQMGITGRGFNFEDAIPQFQNGNIEGPAAKVVNENGLVIGLINAISKEAAAVGSLMILLTSRPAIRPASFVA